ncbi:MAG: methyltransferase domain-containing protein, partial [Chloroflexota bacterium]|nr:methyltransferase domain-containing protein [Chloroflexota bacterium]
MSHAMIDLDAFRDFEATGWERKAEPYDQFFGPITGRIADPLLDAARVGPGIRVLDLATGPGYVAGRAGVRGAAVIGTDIAAAMVALARHRHPGIDFQQADADDLPFAASAFDAVVGNFILPHLGRPLQAVLECARVLAPTGTLALSMWDLPEHNRLFGVLTDAVAEVGVPTPAEIPAGPPFFHYAPDDALAGLLEMARFGRVAIERIQFVHRIPSPDALWAGLTGG